MSQHDRDERVARLKAAGVERSIVAETSVRRALVKMRNRGTRATIGTVAAEANVSVSYLAKHEELRREVHELRRSQRLAHDASAQTGGATNESARVQLEVIRERNRIIEAENALLRRENETLRGEVLALGRKTRTSTRRA